MRYDPIVPPDARNLLVAAAVVGALAGACRAAPARPPAAPLEATPASNAPDAESAPNGSSAVRSSGVIGAPHNPPGTAHPPLREHWEDTLRDDDCKDDPKTGLPCPRQSFEKNCCAGRNECKGQSGCRTAKQSCAAAGACAGKNPCKGQGTSCPPVPVSPGGP